MKKKINLNAIGIVALLLILSFIIPVACDHVRPNSKFRIAVPRNEISYRRAADHLKLNLERGAFGIEVILTKTSQEAATLVATGEADLCLLLNMSLPVANSLGAQAAQLRTIAPLFRRAMFFYVKADSVVDVISPALSFRNKIIGIETEDDEAMIGISDMLDRAGVEKSYSFAADSPSGTYSIDHVWSSFYAPRHVERVANGWKAVSLDENWIKFLCINNSSLVPVVIPPRPGNAAGKEIHTVYSEVLLLASASLGNNAIYALSRYIHENRVHLLSLDRMYESIREEYDKSSLLFALHGGADAYARRDNPSFVVRLLMVSRCLPCS